MDVDKSPARIRSMFAAIAPRYDRVNSILTLRLDRRWRRFAARNLLPRKGRVLDLAAGTGDFSSALASTGHEVVAADFTIEMLMQARGKAKHVVAADALRLPFRNSVFEGVTVGWGVRNFADPAAGIAEIHRVLRPRGAFGVLDVSTPAPLLRPFFRLYFNHIMPLLGRLISGSSYAYSYLRDSVRQFPEGAEFLEMMRGFDRRNVRRLSAGIVSFYRGERV